MKLSHVIKCIFVIGFVEVSSTASNARVPVDPDLTRALNRAYDLKKSSSPSRIPLKYQEFISGLRMILDKWERTGKARPIVGYPLGENQFLTDLPKLMRKFFEKNLFLPNLVEVAYLDYKIVTKMSTLGKRAATQRGNLNKDFDTGTGFIYGLGGKISVSKDSWDVDTRSNCHMHFDGPLVGSPSDLHHSFDSVHEPCATDIYFYTKIDCQRCTGGTKLATPTVQVSKNSITVTCFKKGAGFWSPPEKFGEYTEPIKSKLARYLFTSVEKTPNVKHFNLSRALMICQAVSVVFRRYSELARGHVADGTVIGRVESPPSSVEATAFFHPDFMSELKKILRPGGRVLAFSSTHGWTH